MPMAAAQQSLLGMAAFRPGQYVLVSNKAHAQAAQAQAAAYSAQHAALANILMAQQGVSLRDAVTEGCPKNRRGQTRREWLDALDARIGMVEASGFPIPAEEMADIEVEALEWESIYA